MSLRGADEEAAGLPAGAREAVPVRAANARVFGFPAAPTSSWRCLTFRRTGAWEIIREVITSSILRRQRFGIQAR
jgi:hypothetical protein